MKCQASLTAFIVNSKRIVKLIETYRAIIKKSCFKATQITDLFVYKKKGAYYFKNNKLLFQWPPQMGALFCIDEICPNVIYLIFNEA